MYSRKKFHEAWQTGEAKLKTNCWRSVHGVTLYATRIVDWSSGTSVRLYTGGFRTVSTKSHMNDVLRAMGVKAHVFQKDGAWFVQHADGVSDFVEGFELRITPCGMFVAAGE